MGKRKAAVLEQSGLSNGAPATKKAATETNAVHLSFGPSLFSKDTRSRYAAEYATSEPYKHAVVSPLIADDLLRAVRREIIEHVHFTPKETDIYRIHQSGDLANLSGLQSSALDKLPSLLRLRDALYSREFRGWISGVAGSGPLSGSKTDMAINVYVPGCHLLCHDDVIGTRRLSYILYLTDPDKPWKAEWGGSLRLHATDERKNEAGKSFKLPRAEWSKLIPPAWNQLSFFAVQPGESFHDVEEVYHAPLDEHEASEHGGRVRMAISGWFHIPQEGEKGFEPGLEEQLVGKSSLAQLQGKADPFEEPRLEWIDPAAPSTIGSNGSGKGKSRTAVTDSDDELSEQDLQFLLNYITPNYLTPDTVDELNEIFADESTLQLTDFLSKRFASRLREQLSQTSPKFTHDMHVARPPHKHRFEYLSSSPSLRPTPVSSEEDPHGDLLTRLLPSLAFRKWLALATGLTLKRCAALARRFRRGLDYQLAQSFDGESPQLEYTLCVTPTPGWGGDEDRVDGEADNGNGEASGGTRVDRTDENDNVGGYEIYMAGDDPDASDDGASDHGVSIPQKLQSQTGAGDRRSAKGQRKADPAIYQSAQDDEDDGILFSNPASWNTLSLVLRDRGVLRFVKYVSHAAKGDRWDFAGAVEVEDDEGGEVNDEDKNTAFEGFAD